MRAYPQPLFLCLSWALFFQRGRSTRATNRPQGGRKYILVHFLFCLFLKTLRHKFCKAKNRNKIQLLPNLQQEVEGVGEMRENIQSIMFQFAFLSVILKDQNGMLLPLSFMSPLTLHNHMNAEDEEASFKSLRIFCMMTSIFTFSHTGKSHFHGAPPNSECISP